MMENKDLELIRTIMKEELNKTKGEIVEETKKEIIGETKGLMDELTQYYRINKLENDNTALLLKILDQLTKRVEELEKKTA